MYFGLIAGGFKPFTSGHYFLVKKAAEDNDQVYLFVSTKDRVRPGEKPITWDMMKPVWKLIEKHLPKNVKVFYSENPTTNEFQVLTSAEKDPNNHNVYVLYTDMKDIKRYDNPRIKERTLKRLYSNDQLIFKGFERKSNVDVSGTKVRKALQDNDLEAFVSMMPEPIQQYGHQIFKLLGGEITS